MSLRRPTPRRDFLRLSAAAALSATCRPQRLQAAADLPPGVLHVGDLDELTGAAAAVVVGDVPLVHTEQVLRSPTVGKSAIAATLDGLDECLRIAGASLQDTVRLNVYGRHPNLVDSLREELSVRFRGRYRPTLTLVETAPFDEQHPLAADCVAVTRKTARFGSVQRFHGAAVLPPLHKLYVSGDAAPGPLDEAVHGTLAGLESTLKFCGLDWSHAVQLKSFLQPITAAGDVRRIVQEFFGDRPVPVLSFVEWRSSEKLPIEIELIAAVPPELGNQSNDAVEYLTPPGAKASPVFSRVARVRSDRTIYVSGLYGESSDPAEQVRNVFGRLKQTVEPLGSDLRHLVKATYYVTEDVTSKTLGTLRPEFYDPARPPAASKALVSGTGRRERTLTLDMIAVPRRNG